MDETVLKDINNLVYKDKHGVYDHLGNKYSTIKEMAEAYNLLSSTLRHRLKNGVSLAEALTGDYLISRDSFGTIYKDSKCAYDHLGNKYRTIKEMCKAYGIKDGTFSNRINLGWSLKDTLTGDTVVLTSVNGEIYKDRYGNAYDHLGNKYKSVNEMCDIYGIKYATFMRRMLKSWELEKALNTKATAACDKDGTVYAEIDGVYTDHLGNKYDMQKKMCDAYGITQSLFNYRIKNGYNLKDALETPLTENNKGKNTTAKDKNGVTYRDENGVYDHLGNKYSTIKEMCEAYGIKVSLFRTRIRHGDSLAEALGGYKNTIKDIKTDIQGNVYKDSSGFYDHLRNRYNSEKELVEQYCKNSTTFSRRIEQGWTVQEALEIPTDYQIRLSGKNRIGVNLFLVTGQPKGKRVLSLAEIKELYNLD